MLEGVLKHTSTKKNGKPSCNINRFLLNDNVSNQFNDMFKKFLDYENSVTLEGQVVAIADENCDKDSMLSHCASFPRPAPPGASPGRAPAFLAVDAGTAPPKSTLQLDFPIALESIPAFFL